MRIFEMKGVWCTGLGEQGWARTCEVDTVVEVSLLVGGYYRSLALTPEQAHVFADQINAVAYRIEAAVDAKPVEAKKK